MILERDSKGRILKSDGTRHDVKTRAKIGLASSGRKPTVKQLEALNRGRKELNERKKQQAVIDGDWSSYEEYLKNKDSYHAKRRRARLAGALGSHTHTEWEKLKEEYFYTCLCCKTQEPEITLQQDHIIPISRGGSDNIENIQPLCGTCNRIKKDKTMDFKINTFEVKGGEYA